MGEVFLAGPTVVLAASPAMEGAVVLAAPAVVRAAALGVGPGAALVRDVYPEVGRAGARGAGRGVTPARLGLIFLGLSTCIAFLPSCLLGFLFTFIFPSPVLAFAFIFPSVFGTFIPSPVPAFFRLFRCITFLPSLVIGFAFTSFPSGFVALVFTVSLAFGVSYKYDGTVLDN